MNKLRSLLTWAVLVLLTLGYALSQLAYFRGVDAVRTYSLNVDNPRVKYLSLVIFLVIVGIAFFAPSREDPSDSGSESK